jgi:hypothetical protein
MTISSYLAGKVFSSIAAISRRQSSAHIVISASPRAARPAVSKKFGSSWIL